MKSKKRIFSILFVLMMIVSLILPSNDIEAATKIKINKTKATIYIGQTETLKITGTKKKVTWTSSNKKVASVNSKGKVTPKKEGTATITAKVSGKKYKCKVTVKKPYINVKKKTLEAGKSYTLKLTGTTIKSAKTSNAKVAVVSKKGKVTAKKAGTATITLTGKNGKKYTCKITVKNHSHVWDKGVITKEPTFLKKGIKTYTCKTCGKTKTESISPKEATTEEDFIQKFYEKYGGKWDCEGINVGAGMCTGRSLYTNSVYNTSFKISTETRVCNDRFIVDMNDVTPSDGAITECIDDGYIWLAGTVDFDLYLYTQKNTKWSVESETSFINSYAEKYKENHVNHYDKISFGKIYTMKIGGNKYYCVDHLDMNVRDIGNIYYYETLLVRKCDDKMLVYYINDTNNQIGVDSGGVTEAYIREHILY